MSLKHPRRPDWDVRAAGPGVLERPELDDLPTPTDYKGWIVTVFDNDYNTYEQVMAILMLATGCCSDEAYIETWEIDHFGKCVVHHACERVCRKAAEIIGTIGIRVEVTEE
jgi:hypothetical protein